MEGQKNIMMAIEDYFRDIYYESIPVVELECLQVIPSIFDQAMNEALLAPVVSSEVKKVVFSLSTLKAHGPDGLNGEFFQNNWHVIHDDVEKAVSLFFNTSELGEFVNETLVALTPKVPNPESICQLRPISCCNFIYKVISMIMVHRLKPLLSNLISP